MIETVAFHMYWLLCGEGGHPFVEVGFCPCCERGEELSGLAWYRIQSRRSWSPDVTRKEELPELSQLTTQVDPDVTERAEPPDSYQNIANPRRHRAEPTSRSRSGEGRGREQQPTLSVLVSDAIGTCFWGRTTWRPKVSRRRRCRRRQEGQDEARRVIPEGARERYPSLLQNT